MNVNLYNNDGTALIMTMVCLGLEPTLYIEAPWTAIGVPVFVDEFSNEFYASRYLIGVATTPNQTLAKYRIGDTIPITEGMNLYLIEATPETNAAATIVYKDTTIILKTGETAALHLTNKKLTGDIAITVSGTVTQ